MRTKNPITVLGPDGRPLAGASVYTRVRATGDDAEVFAAETGSAPGDNPATSDARGRVVQWCERSDLASTITAPGMDPWVEEWDSAPAADRAIDDLWLPDRLSEGALEAAIDTKIAAIPPVVVPTILPNVKWRGAWVSGTAYAVNDVVSNDGYYWRCVTATNDTTAPPTNLKWTLFYAWKSDPTYPTIGPFTPRVNALYRVWAITQCYPGGTGNGTYMQVSITENGGQIEGYQYVGYIDNFGGYRQYQYQSVDLEYVRERSAGVATTYGLAYNNNGWSNAFAKMVVQEIAHA